MKNNNQKISHRVVYCHAAIAFLLTAGIAVKVQTGGTVRHSAPA